MQKEETEYPFLNLTIRQELCLFIVLYGTVSELSGITHPWELYSSQTYFFKNFPTKISVSSVLKGTCIDALILN